MGIFLFDDEFDMLLHLTIFDEKIYLRWNEINFKLHEQMCFIWLVWCFNQYMNQWQILWQQTIGKKSMTTIDSIDTNQRMSSVLMFTVSTITGIIMCANQHASINHKATALLSDCTRKRHFYKFRHCCCTTFRCKIEFYFSKRRKKKVFSLIPKVLYRFIFFENDQRNWDRQYHQEHFECSLPRRCIDRRYSE